MLPPPNADVCRGVRPCPLAVVLRARDRRECGARDRRRRGGLPVKHEKIPMFECSGEERGCDQLINGHWWLLNAVWRAFHDRSMPTAGDRGPNNR